MDRPGPDTELKKIVDYLETNGYEFEGIVNDRFVDDNDAIADFNKKIVYYHPEIGWIRDNYIKVSIQFQKRADYKNFTHYGKDENDLEDDDEYIGDLDTFILGLMEEENQDSTGGTRRKKRKTRKNRRKNSNRRKK
jgi:hypothetical protein